MKPLRALLVEDVEDDAALVLRELARGEYDVAHRRVDTVQTLREALKTEAWDLIISDFSLPRLTAMDVLDVLAASGLDLPCIIISGTISEESAVGAMKHGASDFIAKDRLARLLPAVSRELREAAQRRQKRTAEAALDQAEERMRFALEAAAVGTWESDLVSGKRTWSDGMERLHGMPAGGFRGTFQAFTDTIHPEDRQSVLARIAQAARDRTESRLEYRVIWPDGSIHWISRVGQTFYDADGSPVRAAGVAMDITLQKNLEEQFRLAQKMESIGSLAGGIAHDFNNLLTVILGFTNFILEELTERQTPDVDTLQRDMEEIRKAGERAAALTSQLLAFSRRQIIQPTILNVDAIAANMEPMLRRVIGEDIELTVRRSPDLGSANVDAGQLEQVIMNLVVNARDALPTGGKITIETSNIELDDTYARDHIAVVPGRYVMLAVSDTGIGIPPEVRGRIFEPFFTTKPKGRGTGLGLATIYGIVKQSNGNIWVYSEPGIGTTFKVYLPRASGAPESAMLKAESGIRGGSETILLVEDDERVRKLVHEMLKRNGYQVIEAADAEQALRLAASHPGRVDLLLTDVVMPGMGGRLLAERISDRHPEIRVLYMSGYADDAIVHHGVLDAGVAFLQKPFTPTTFSRAIRDALEPPP